jgi:hypothetical protein
MPVCLQELDAKALAAEPAWSPRPGRSRGGESDGEAKGSANRRRKRAGSDGMQASHPRVIKG